MNAPAAPSRAGRWIVLAASVVVVATIVAAIAVMGPPSRQRLLRLDERRVNDLQVIQSQVEMYRDQHGAVPASLAVLATQPGMRVPRDPASRQPYGYEAIDGAGYRLCAQFDTDTAQSADVQPWMRPDWGHGTGRQCFKRRAGKVRE